MTVKFTISWTIIIYYGPLQMKGFAAYLYTSHVPVRATSLVFSNYVVEKYKSSSTLERISSKLYKQF